MLMTNNSQATMQIYQMMSQTQEEIPGQVLFQQPVHLEDARGVVAPFHLEFVTSPNVSCALAFFD